jgi:phospholipid transport system substrate-binding protein
MMLRPARSVLLLAFLATVSFAPTVMAEDLSAPAAGITYTAASASQASQADQAAFQFVQKTTDRGLAFLANTKLTKAQKSNEFRKLLESSFDLDTIGRFALGRYWHEANPSQRAEYSKLFRTMVVNVYTNRFDEYKGQKVEVKSFRSIGNNDTLVTSFIMAPTGGDPVQVDWRVRNRGGSHKIVDVIVAGVSMSVTQRSDFASVIQQGGGDIEALLTKLRDGKLNKAS